VVLWRWVVGHHVCWVVWCSEGVLWATVYVELCGALKVCYGPPCMLCCVMLWRWVVGHRVCWAVWCSEGELWATMYVELCGALKVCYGPPCMLSCVMLWRWVVGHHVCWVVWCSEGEFWATVSVLAYVSGLVQIAASFIVCSFSVSLFMLENHFKSIGSAAMFHVKLCRLVAMWRDCCEVSVWSDAVCAASHGLSQWTSRFLHLPTYSDGKDVASFALTASASHKPRELCVWSS